MKEDIPEDPQISIRELVLNYLTANIHHCTSIINQRIGGTEDVEMFHRFNRIAQKLLNSFDILTNSDMQEIYYIRGKPGNYDNHSEKFESLYRNRLKQVYKEKGIPEMLLDI